MDVTYYYPWGYFYPVWSGAAATASRHMNYFRSRGMRPRIIVLGNAAAASERNAFERHYGWARDVSVVDLQVYPEIQRLSVSWGFREYLEAHAAIARTPRFREFFAEPADIVMINYVFATPLLDACPAGTPRVLESHDILSRSSVYPNLSSAALQHQLKTEFELYDLYDLVIMVNPHEEAQARQRCSTPVHYVPRSVDISGAQERTTSRQETQYDLLFVGSEHPPNVKGIRWFYEHIFRPHLKSCGLTLAIAGGASREVDLQDPSVTMLGRVDDLRQVYRDAKIVVVPLFEGTGISIKTVEAMGQGMPIVTTPCGRRGLDDCSDSLVCLPFEKEPANAARRIVELSQSSELRQHYGCRAREYAALHFSAEAYGRSMDGLLGNVTRRLLQNAA